MRSVLLCIPIVFIGLLALSMVNAQDGMIGISAFNIRIFGRTKAKKAEVMATIVEIVRKYDIMLIQEIRDSSGEAILQLLDEVNEKGAPQYAMEISATLGRTSSKEQYAFFYRTNMGFQVTQTYQYPDVQDVFQREPYAVKFAVQNSTFKEIVLVAIHTAPDDAVAEINALDDVHTELQQQMGTDNILILGDLNADCDYVTKTAMGKLKLRINPKYHWLISDEIDTTVSTTDCAYDRFILTGEDLVGSVAANSAVVVRFDTEYNLTQTQAEAVSDHYPIAMRIKPQDPILTFMSTVTKALKELLVKLGVNTTQVL